MNVINESQTLTGAKMASAALRLQLEGSLKDRVKDHIDTARHSNFQME